MTKWNRRYLLLGVVAAVLFATAGVAYALTSADFEPRAASWESSSCNETLLKAKETAANNQKIATCFAVEKVKEQQATISGLQTSITKLESTQTPPPLDFTFFALTPVAKGGTAVSPIVDAGKYKTLTLTATERGPVSVFRLEVSNNQELWIPALEIGGGVQNDALPITARYYRITASGASEAGTSVTAVAHLTA